MNITTQTADAHDRVEESSKSQLLSSPSFTFTDDLLASALSLPSPDLTRKRLPTEKPVPPQKRLSSTDTVNYDKEVPLFHLKRRKQELRGDQEPRNLPAPAPFAPQKQRRYLNVEDSVDILVKTPERTSSEEGVHRRIKARQGVVEGTEEQPAPTAKTIPTTMMAVLLTNLTIYAMCIHLCNPLMPYLVKELGGGHLEYGYIMGANSFFQMAGALFGGPYIDRYGPRLTLMVSFVSCSVGYGLLYMSTSLWWLFLSRIAVFGQQAVLASRTFIAVLSNSDTRLLSYINLFYGLGTMLGPALAGVLINQMGSLRVGALFAVLMSLINTGLTLTLLKDPGRNESGPDKVKQRRRSMTEQIRWAMFPGDFSKIQRNRALRWILCVRIPSSIASSLFHAIVSLMLVDRYSLKAAESGWIFSFIGVVVVIAQVLFNVFINHFKYSEKSLLFWASSIMPIGFLLTGMAQSIEQFCAALVPLMASATVMFAISTAYLTKVVPASENGTTIGLDMGISNCLRVLAPFVGTGLISVGGFSTVSVVCAVLSGVAVFIQLSMQPDL